MIDNKVIEAAARAWMGTPYNGDPMRAALAAADKVRAEGFDFDGKARALLKGRPVGASDGDTFLVESPTITAVVIALRRAFAAGLAKGEAELEAATSTLEDEQAAHQETLALLSKGEADRAALVEALKPFRGFWSDDELRGLPDSHLFEMIWARDEESRLNEETGKPYPAITAGQLRRAALALVRKGE